MIFNVQNLFTGAIEDGSYLNDDDDTIDQDLSSLTSFDGLQVIGKYGLCFMRSIKVSGI